ncbi:MAG: BamA/TamA family outer membrane protein [Candidatus Pseudobacter hemicellulosilyticus]|uniref:BamA/TamA family outer membrane protein n=1 Tax=Candidatus Pseudobacter hemicellulosilyticus TaxID=3121375 RepID=A0AAJ6BDX0_9BACT|nr:MAG: BamA/TamA family outer membrane protein [Pseudobacter sp.]
MVLAPACVTVSKKNLPTRPFVYQTEVNVDSKQPRYEKKELSDKLLTQVDDSLQTRFKYVGIFKKLIKPPVFDSINIGRSKVFMTALLNSQGYYRPVITDTFFIDTTRERQYRTTVRFKVIPGVRLIMDSVGYSLETPELQQLALNNSNRSELKKGKPYSTTAISTEIERLVTLYRDNGYYKLNKESIYAEVDTVIAALIDPSLDPFEQIRLLDSLRRRSESPTINVLIKQRPPKDSTHLMKFYFGDITIYPDITPLEDTSFHKDTTIIPPYTFLYGTNRFKLPFIARNMNITPGSLYRQRRYYRTINTFNQLGAWSNVDLDLQERYDSVPLLDATFRLYPDKKQSATIDFETSRNVSDFLTTGQLFGIGLNFRLINRNAFREAIQTSTNARFGIEIGTQLVQTLQASFSHNIYFPKFILPFRIKNPDRLQNTRTVLNLEGAYTDRRDFFRVPSFKTSWGYEWVGGRMRRGTDVPRRRITYNFTPLNFEYTSVVKTDSLLRLEKLIPAYRFAFNDGMIISTAFSASTAIQKDKKLTLIRARIEESGGLTGLIKELELGDLRRFVKVDAEIKHYIDYGRSSLAFRAYGGVGIVYGKTDTAGVVVPESNLPFFKAFSAGGPYSMRAWQVRRLGPGTATMYEPTDSTSAIDRFGNMQLEFNIEYRFNLATIFGFKVNSALFVDMGNIWSKEFDPATGQAIPAASFRIDKLYKDLAIGGGSSLRFDFDFFLIRLDWAYKLKDPVHAYQNAGWFHNLKISDGQFQLGIGYPF